MNKERVLWLAVTGFLVLASGAYASSGKTTAALSTEQVQQLKKAGAAILLI